VDSRIIPTTMNIDKRVVSDVPLMDDSTLVVTLLMILASYDDSMLVMLASDDDSQLVMLLREVVAIIDEYGSCCIGDSIL